MGHDVGTAEEFEDGELRGGGAEAGDFDAGVEIIRVRPAKFGDHFPVQVVGEEADAVGGADGFRKSIDRVSVLDEVYAVGLGGQARGQIGQIRQVGGGRVGVGCTAVSDTVEHAGQLRSELLVGACGECDSGGGGGSVAADLCGTEDVSVSGSDAGIVQCGTEGDETSSMLDARYRLSRNEFRRSVG